MHNATGKSAKEICKQGYKNAIQHIHVNICNFIKKTRIIITFTHSVCQVLMHSHRIMKIAVSNSDFVNKYHSHRDTGTQEPRVVNNFLESRNTLRNRYLSESY
jgi:hypothetical protein